MTQNVRSPLLPSVSVTRAALLSCILGLTVIACAPRSPYAAPLLNQGIVPVSAENPTMGANVFLAKEMEQSLYLHNFIKERGSPQAIEVKGDTFSALEIHLYYSGDKEEYVARPAPRSARSRTAPREWIIMGPFAVDRHQYRAIADLPADAGGVFEIYGHTEYLGKNSPLPEHTQLRPVFVPTPTPPKKIRKKRTSASGESATPRPDETPNFDQLAIQAAKELAERNTSGDVVHTVKSKTETLQSIAQWYTSSPKAAADIASKNGLPADAALKPGTTIVVPKGLVVNPKRMK